MKTSTSLNSSAETSDAFELFLALLGDRVTLEGFKGFSAGLDTICEIMLLLISYISANSTGKVSVYTKFQGLEIMFHVSTLLPHSSNDPQQVSLLPNENLL